MTDTRLLLLTLLLTCLGTAAHWLRDDVRPLKFKLPLWARSALVLVLGTVLVPAVDQLAKTGTPFLTSILQGLVVAVPSLLPLVLDATLRVPPGAALLLVLLGLPTGGCAVSLEQARAEGLAVRRGVPTTAVGVSPSQICRDLSNSQADWRNAERTAVYVGGPTGVGTIVAAVGTAYDKVPPGVTIAAAAATFVAGGVAEFASGKADALALDWSREGCGSP